MVIKIGFLLADTKRLKLILLGGKGGTGKTTAAAAIALHMAGGRPGKRVLVISTDPAHSLSDSIEQSIGSRPTRVKGRKNLWALEIGASQVLAKFKEQYEAVMKRAISHITYLDEQDVTEICELSLPGSHEIAALIEIMNILRSDRYDLILLDTAPTGHTLRLLSLPRQLTKWLRLLDSLRQKHRYLSRRFTGRYIRDDVDMFLLKMAGDLKRISELLTDPLRTEFVPVVVPEAMCIDETRRLVRDLKTNNILTRQLIVNRIVPDDGCSACSLRKEAQTKDIAFIEEVFAGFNIVKAPLFPIEIHGLESLDGFAKALFDKKSRSFRPALPDDRAGELPAASGAIRRPSKLLDIGNKDVKFILFGGKGGVGKTTIAGASAIYLAESNPEKRVLLLSTDPAHSLADAFNMIIGDKITPIPGIANLSAVEICASKLFEDLKTKYTAEAMMLFNDLSIDGFEVKFERQMLNELMSLAPPGLDEVMALSELIKLKQKGEYDQFVLDMPPTGHLLGFLELPESASGWLRTILKLFLKYKNIVGLGRMAELTLDLKRAVREIGEQLTSSADTEFIVVAVPETMVVEETQKLLARLRHLKIPCRHIVVNMVVSQIACGFCLSKRRGQQEQIAIIERQNASRYAITQAPLIAQSEIKGIAGLRHLAGILFETNSSGTGPIAPIEKEGRVSTPQSQTQTLRGPWVPVKLKG